jgi:hypothetical protein
MYRRHSVPDRVIRSQLARPTRSPGFSLNVKICDAMHIIPEPFVLFLLVIYKCLRSRTLDLHSNLSKPSQSSSVGSPAGYPWSMWLREDVESVYFWDEARKDSFATAPLTG